MLAKRRRSLSLRAWRGTPEELKALADTVVEALDVARRSAFRQYEAQSYEKYSQDISQLQEDLGIADLAALTLDDPVYETYVLRSQSLWHSTRRTLEQGMALIAPSHDFGYRLKTSVEEEGKTPDIFLSSSMPRGVVGVWARSNLFSSPTASVTVQLQNMPYAWLELVVEGEDWIWLEATFGRLSEQIHRGESAFLGFLYRPGYAAILILGLWGVFAVLASEGIRQVPWKWAREREWLGLLFGLVPLAISQYVLGWLYPRFEVLHSVAREQTDAARWLIVAVVGAGAIAFFTWLIRLVW